MKSNVIKSVLLFFLCVTMVFAGTMALPANANTSQESQTESQKSEAPEVSESDQIADLLTQTGDVEINVISNPTIISDGRELHQLSEEELSSDTHMLLDIVLNSEYIRIARTSARLLSSGEDPLPTRYFEFNGYLELLTRIDLEDVLLLYIDSASDWEFTVLQDMLTNSELKDVLSTTVLKSIVSSIPQENKNMPRLVDPPEWEELIGEDDIRLISAGYVSFAGGQVIPVYRTSREYTSSEQTRYDSRYPANDETQGVRRIFSADASYNCHSYAWHLMDNSNPYWIQNGDMYRPNTAEMVGHDDIQEYDIVVYHSRENIFLHSAVVVEISDDKTIWLQSKWGQAGVYRHRIDTVPSGYLASDGTALYSVYRYHSYNRTTADLGHVGTRHLYQHTDHCVVCLNTVITSVRVSCSGPPCIMPFSMRSLSA